MTSAANHSGEGPELPIQEVIILITDGLNTENRYSTTQADIDAREQITCNSANRRHLLYTCRSTPAEMRPRPVCRIAAARQVPDSDKFFLLTSGIREITTFNQIGTELSNLRVAK